MSAATATRMAAPGRREHLLETAARVFTEGSYRGTTTAEIARAAGISEPIIYRHFASKRDLYIATIEHVWEKARAGWEQAVEASTDACAAVEAIHKGHVSVRSAKLQLAELWVQALSEASEDPELKKHLRRHMREVHDFLADLDPSRSSAGDDLGQARRRRRGVDHALGRDSRDGRPPDRTARRQASSRRSARRASPGSAPRQLGSRVPRPTCAGAAPANGKHRAVHAREASLHQPSGRGKEKAPAAAPGPLR